MQLRPCLYTVCFHSPEALEHYFIQSVINLLQLLGYEAVASCEEAVHVVHKHKI